MPSSRDCAPSPPCAEGESKIAPEDVSLQQSFNILLRNGSLRPNVGNDRDSDHGHLIGHTSQYPATFAGFTSRTPASTSLVMNISDHAGVTTVNHSNEQALTRQPTSFHSMVEEFQANSHLASLSSRAILAGRMSLQYNLLTNSVSLLEGTNPVNSSTFGSSEPPLSWPARSNGIPSLDIGGSASYSAIVGPSALPLTSAMSSDGRLDTISSASVSQNGSHEYLRALLGQAASSIRHQQFTCDGVQGSLAIPGVFDGNESRLGQSESNRTLLSQLPPSMSLVRNSAWLQVRPYLDYLSFFEKEAIQKAVHLCPKLVLSESDPVRFLRCTNNQVHAAKKMADYWRCRVEIFGERAFLPLAVADDVPSAMSQVDINAIETGVFALLSSDSVGGPVFCWDDSRLVPAIAGLRCRALFYVAHALSQNELSQSDGCDALFVVTNESMPDMTTVHCASLLKNVFPIKINNWHIVNRTGEEKAFIDALCSIRHLFGSQSLFLHENLPILHDHPKKCGIAESLGNHGLIVPGLPLSLGGGWSYERVHEWLQERRDIDRNMHTRSTEHRIAIPDGQSFAHYNPESSASPPNELASKPRPLLGFHKSRFIGTLCKLLESAMTCTIHTESFNYFEAIAKAKPSVWENESRLELFLRVDDFHVGLAAKRLSRYWSIRVKTFGEQGFQSMYQTGEDALERGDLSVLSSGFLMLLPDDAEGCPIIWIDTSKVPADSHPNSCNRCLFYMFSLATENELSQKSGAVIVLNIASGIQSNLDLRFVKNLAHSMPLTIKAVHVIKNQGTVDTLEPSFEFTDSVFVHHDSSNELIAQRISSFGIKISSLPQSLGGEWDASKFSHWQELRTRMEWKVPIGLGGKELEDALKYPAIRRYVVLSDTERLERKRRLNVVHSRRKRDRRRVMATVVEDQHKQLLRERTVLISENERLVGLIRAASDVVQRMAG